MHRRSIVQLSHRHGVPWPSTARLLNPAPAHPPRRRFHSYPFHLSPSDPHSTNDADATANSSASPSSTPKFRPRWGKRPTQGPAVLSAEEQAIRNALLDKSTRQQARKVQQQEKQTRKPKPPSSQRRDGDWICLNCGNLCFSRSVQCRKCGTSRPTSRSISSAGDGLPQKPKLPFLLSGDRQIQEQSGGNKTLKGRRPTDWICPNCGYLCYGTRFCRRCDTARPATNTGAEQPNPTQLENGTGGPLRIRKIATPRASDIDGESSRKSALRKHIARHQEKEHRSEEEAHRRDRRPKPSEPKETGVKTDPWSWDPSSLDRLKFDDEQVEHGKSSKRRADHRRREHEEEDDEEFDEDEYSRRREERRRLKKEKSREKEASSALPPLHLPEFISVSNFADVIGTRPSQFVAQLEEMGFEDVTYSHILDADTAGLIAAEFGFEPIFDTSAEYDLTPAPEPEDKSIWPPRPPVVTIMGHVDHGKTTLLDWLRKSSVVASEHGGITQHIGAFSVSMPSGKTITFLDTPGHAAFLDMRRRGADVTDIVVLVVAADDSVKPQTIEAIKHATSAKVPLIVAISKIDKPGINPEKVKQDLAVQGIHVEDYGGDVQAIGVSGKTGQGMLELEEAIITLSEVLDHRADREGAVEGWVIEGTTKSYGRVATVLVRRGVLRPGDIVVAGTAWTRVRTLRNEAGVTVSEATPGMPVEMDGWREQPVAGTEFLQAEDEQHAKDVVEYRQERTDAIKLGEDTAAINEARRELAEKRQKEASKRDQSAAEEEVPSGPKPVHFVLKADVGGSAEAVLNSVTAVGNNEVYANVLRSEVGPVSEFDIEHAAVANGPIINFNMPIDPAMLRMAESKGVTIMDHNVIYKLVDEVKDLLSELLPPNVTHRVTGEAEVGQIFEITVRGRVKTFIAGCRVRNGVINRASKVRVLRGQETIYDGSITSLKNVKKDVTEMRKDTECGMAFENWTAFAVGDKVQCYEEVFEKRHL
ncbi:translation initiation factor 2 [Aspergillus lucknowensis]|uniref:Translation initiation factor IF-2, mitochondrial n=1 Tax=Aspergillus lucknowensis TaxID=176173 RepID=A0ABR4LQC3_9EURO